MMTAELGQCEWFVWDLRRSSLVERGRLDQMIADFLAQNPSAEPAELATYLVEHGILSQFQAESLLAGKNQGLVLGPYVVTDTLGTGSMGTVYRATSKNNNKVYAVKVLPRRSMWNIRLARRKVRDFEQIQHPAVVPFVDVGTAGSMHFLAWPYVDGQPLHKVVEEQGRLSPGTSAAYGMQTAEGLDATHQIGIIHGLLKPSNILITPENDVRILDYGVGALLSETENESVVDTMSTANTMASGLDCASPEGIMDPTQMTVASDQYSLGCVLYYCLTGSMPFPGSNAVEKMMAHQTKEPPSIKDASPETPDGLVEVVKRLMQKVPSERYPTMADAVAALQPFATATAGSAPRPRPVSPPTPALPVRGRSEAVNETVHGAKSLASKPTPPPPARPGVHQRPPSSGPTLPERRPSEMPAAAQRPLPPPFEPRHNHPPSSGSGFNLPQRPTAIPTRARLTQPDPEPSGNVSVTTILITVAALIGACVAGWFLAGSF